MDQAQGDDDWPLGSGKNHGECWRILYWMLLDAMGNGPYDWGYHGRWLCPSNQVDFAGGF